MSLYFSLFGSSAACFPGRAASPRKVLLDQPGSGSSALLFCVRGVWLTVLELGRETIRVLGKENGTMTRLGNLGWVNTNYPYYSPQASREGLVVLVY